MNKVVLKLLCLVFVVVSLFSIVTAQEAEFPVAVPESVGISKDQLQKLDNAVHDGKLQKVTSIMVARHGKLVYQKYYDGFTLDSLHDTRSVTKTITSILIGQAIEKKFIPSERTKAFEYFADKKPIQNPDSRKNQITIEDLLTMSSLLECDDDNQFSSGNEERMYLTKDYFRFALNLSIRGFPPFATKPKDSPYGRSFSYCTAGVVLLGGILERSSKMKVEDFAKKYLFDELGIRKFEWQFTPMGMPMTGGGLRLRSNDFLKIAQLFLNNGEWNGKHIISADWIKKSTTPYVNARDNVDYGYLWWLQKFGPKEKAYSAYYMAGNGGSKIAVFPGLDMVVVLTSNMYGTSKAHQQSEKILSEYIVPSITN